MELILTVLRCPDSTIPEPRRVSSGGEFRIGRGADCDWMLPDPDRVLSKHHCIIECRDGGWLLRDMSVNGTFHNGAGTPIGRESAVPLLDGDRIRLGAYELEVRLQQQASAPPPLPGLGGTAPNWGGPQAAPLAPWEAPPPAPQSWGADPVWMGDPKRAQPMQPRLPGDAFPVAGHEAPPMPGSAAPDPRFTDEGPVMPDHASPVNAAFYVPEPLPQHLQNWDRPHPMPGQAPPPVAPPPDGWSLESRRAPPGGMGDRPEPAPISGPAAPLPGLSAPDPGALPPAAPVARAPAPLPGFAPPEPFPGLGGPPDAPLMPAFPAAPAAAPVTAVPIAHGPNPFENEPALRAPGLAPIAPPVPVDVPPPMVPLQPAEIAMAPAPAPVPVGNADAALAALLAGMGLAPTPALTADPAATLRAAGAALRAAIGGMRALLIARAEVKRDFRIEATMLGVANNPVKFSHNDEAALQALLGAPAMGPRAVQETVADLTAHQVATMAATQAAARALLDRLAPAGVEAADPGGSLFGAGRDKRLWEAYKRLHQQVTSQFEDDFDSAFGKAFARAYEQAQREGRG